MHIGVFSSTPTPLVIGKGPALEEGKGNDIPRGKGKPNQGKGKHKNKGKDFSPSPGKGKGKFKDKGKQPHKGELKDGAWEREDTPPPTLFAPPAKGGGTPNNSLSLSFATHLYSTMPAVAWPRLRQFLDATFYMDFENFHLQKNN